jgi:hypothetical protein
MQITSFAKRPEDVFLNLTNHFEVIDALLWKKVQKALQIHLRYRPWAKSY